MKPQYGYPADKFAVLAQAKLHDIKTLAAQIETMLRQFDAAHHINIGPKSLEDSVRQIDDLISERYFEERERLELIISQNDDGYHQQNTHNPSHPNHL